MDNNNLIPWRLHSYYASLFCSVLLPVLSFFWVLLRSGFPGDTSTSLFLLNGISLLILFLPHVISQSQNESALPSSVISLGTLLCLCLLGYTSFITSLNNIGHGVALIGYASFFIAGWKHHKELKSVYVLLFLFAGLLLALYVTGSVWGIFALSPTFTESLLVLPKSELGYTVDTLYHSTHSQMLRTYGTFSTGLDGFPLTYYHLGNHWVLGQLSNLIQVPVIIMFNLGFPIISIPLFLFTFMDFALHVAEKRAVRIFPSFFFWFIVLCVFMQMPKGLYSGGLLGMSIFNNESYTLSMAFFFGIGASLVTNGITTDRRTARITLLIVVPIFFFLAGWSKISTGFVLSGLLGYLYLRLRGWENRMHTISLFTCALIFLATYWYSVETIPFGLRNLNSEGTFQWFHFYRSTHDFRPFDWIVLFYFWTYAIVLLVLVSREQVTPFRFQTLALEAALITAAIGVLPSIAMSFSGGNSGYFAGMQLFFSGALVAGFSDRIQQGWDYATRSLPRTGKVFIAAVLIFGIASFIWKSIRENHEDMFRKNVLTRQALIGKPFDPGFNVSLFGKEIQDVFKKPVMDSLLKMPGWSYIQGLQTLERLPAYEKLHTVLFKNPSLPTLFPNQICITETFLTPAYGGLVMMDGIPGECKLGIYGETYYREFYSGSWKTRTSTDSLFSEAKRRGFHNLQIYDEATNSFIHFGF